jgi:hypothetical protein
MSDEWTTNDDLNRDLMEGMMKNEKSDDEPVDGTGLTPKEALAMKIREKLIRAECDFIANMLAEKNRNYGDSALNPVRIMSQADPVEQIRVRIDDKLSRIKRGKSAGEDVVLDLTGYFILLRIAMRRKEAPMAVPAGTQDSLPEGRLWGANPNLCEQCGQVRLSIDHRCVLPEGKPVAAPADALALIDEDGMPVPGFVGHARPSDDGDAPTMLRNLLARIHRDGGHHTEKVGLARSVYDADKRVALLHAERTDRAESTLAEAGQVTDLRAKLAEAERERDEMNRDRENALAAYSDFACRLGISGDENRSLRAQIEAMRPLTAVVKAFLAHYLHVSTGAAGTQKRREWEQETDRLAMLLDEHYRAATATPASRIAAATVDYDPPGREHTVGDGMGLRRAEPAATAPTPLRAEPTDESWGLMVRHKLGKARGMLEGLLEEKEEGKTGEFTVEQIREVLSETADPDRRYDAVADALSWLWSAYPQSRGDVRKQMRSAMLALGRGPNEDEPGFAPLDRPAELEGVLRVTEETLASTRRVLTEEASKYQREADSWKDTAAQAQRNTDYYVGLLDQIAALLGEAAYVSDDGSKQDTPVRAKMPGLVKEAFEELRAEAKRAWTHVEEIAAALGCGTSKVQILMALTMTMANATRETEEARNGRDEAIRQRDALRIERDALAADNGAMLREIEALRSRVRNGVKP